MGARNTSTDIELMSDVINDPGQGDRFTRALGLAVVEAWSALPRTIQQTLFEQAVLAGHRTERDEALREQLATFLHERHPRTGDGDRNPDDSSGEP